MLKGGINYFNKIKPKKANGQVNVLFFDNRVTIKDAKQGTYGICSGCRMPISKKEMQSPKYK